MENNCCFVNSWGILKSCHIHSSDPKHDCSQDIQHLDDVKKGTKMFDNVSIYVCSNALSYFVKNILPFIKNNFTLVSGDSDMCTPLESLRPPLFDQLVNYPFLIRWFAQNTRIQKHPKIVQMPIGLDFHTFSKYPYYNLIKEGEETSPLGQEKILFSIREMMKPFYERHCKVFMQFGMNDRFGQRKGALEQIPSFLVFSPGGMKRTDTWKAITEYSFVVSPFGNGMDCHRTWETLALGAIPIVKALNFEALFHDLPVWIVREWTEITEESMHLKIEEFKQKEIKGEFNYNKITLEYWKNQINCCKINN
jgi:hypothetical protein